MAKIGHCSTTIQHILHMQNGNKGRQESGSSSSAQGPPLVDSMMQLRYPSGCHPAATGARAQKHRRVTQRPYHVDLPHMSDTSSCCLSVVADEWPQLQMNHQDPLKRGPTVCLMSGHLPSPFVQLCCAFKLSSPSEMYDGLEHTYGPQVSSEQCASGPSEARCSPLWHTLV